FGLRADHPCSQFEKQGRGGEAEIMSCGLSQGTHEFRVRDGAWSYANIDAFLTIDIQPSYHACNIRHVYPTDVLFSVALPSPGSEFAEVEQGDDDAAVSDYDCGASGYLFCIGQLLFFKCTFPELADFNGEINVCLAVVVRIFSMAYSCKNPVLL